MFLIERLFGVAAYSILLLIVFLGISGSSKKSSLKSWLLFYVVMLSVLAFYYKPHQDADLYTQITYMHSWSNMTPATLLDYCSHSSTPAYIAYFWIIGQTGIDGLLTATTCFIYFLLLFSCFWEFAYRYDIDTKYAAWGIALFMSFGVFLEVISGIRSSLTIAVSFWCYARELVLNKNPIVHIPMYLIASLMHPVGLFLTLLRFLMLTLQKTDNVYKSFIYLVISVSGIVAVIILGPDYVNAMIDKGVSYSTHYIYSSIWETIIHVILIVISVVLFFRQCDKSFIYRDDLAIRNLITVQLVLLGIVFAGFFLDYAIYHRMSTYLGMFSALVFPLVMKGEVERYGTMPKYINFIQYLIIVMFALACTRGNLSNYKFFVM